MVLWCAHPKIEHCLENLEEEELLRYLLHLLQIYIHMCVCVYVYIYIYISVILRLTSFGNIPFTESWLVSNNTV